MTFESGVTAFAERFLSDRSLTLIVGPALADLHFDRGAGRWQQAANYFAVIRAVAGGVCDEAARGSGFFAVLTLMIAVYNVVLLTLFADFIEFSSHLGELALVLIVLSLAPVVACFWPERRTAPRAD